MTCPFHLGCHWRHAPQSRTEICYGHWWCYASQGKHSMILRFGFLPSLERPSYLRDLSSSTGSHSTLFSTCARSTERGGVLYRPRTIFPEKIDRHDLRVVFSTRARLWPPSLFCVDQSSGNDDTRWDDSNYQNFLRERCLASHNSGACLVLWWSRCAKDMRKNTTCDTIKWIQTLIDRSHLEKQ